MGATISAGLLIAFIHIIVIWDVVAGMKWGYQATVSWVLNGWFSDMPVLLLAIGVLIGHTAWPLKAGPVSPPLP